MKGALSAALYPQVACMDSETQTSKRPAWLAKDLSVAVHPSSVLHPLLSPQYFSPFVLFSEKMQTSSVYMRDISVVPAIALVLFGGHLEVHHDSGYILLDSWLKVLSLLACCQHLSPKRVVLAWYLRAFCSICTTRPSVHVDRARFECCLGNCSGESSCANSRIGEETQKRMACDDGCSCEGSDGNVYQAAASSAWCYHRFTAGERYARQSNLTILCCSSNCCLAWYPV